MTFLRNEITRYSGTGDGTVGHFVRVFEAPDPGALESLINIGLQTLKTAPETYRLLSVDYQVRVSNPQYSALVTFERVTR